jgi:hypothetical protein
MKNIVFPVILFMNIATHASINNDHVKNSQGEAIDA